MSSNWRQETDAADYFGHQQKKLNVADRRPVIRRASDLVGPGIGASATRITDFSDLLATYNGYFSSVPGARHAPNDTEAFVGHVVMDDTLGGRQVFTGLTSRTEYARVFVRNPGDPSNPDTILWGDWTTSDEAGRLVDFSSDRAARSGDYYAVAGAANAPNSTEAFIGRTTNDALAGGWQEFVGMTSRTKYTRTFTRDPYFDNIVWREWVATPERNIISALRSTGVRSTSLPQNTMSPLTMPSVALTGPSGVFEVSAAEVYIRKQGVYTGHFRVGGPQAATVDIQIWSPDWEETTSVTTPITIPAGGGAYFPVTFVSGTATKRFQISARPSVAYLAFQISTLVLTRIGDAR